VGIQYKNFEEDELSKFKQFQRQSYRTLEQIKQELVVGMTEIEVARLIRKHFHQQGVHSYFHVPVALFGERTGYPNDFGQLEALATDKKLEQGMPIILDAAPIYDGYIVDTSFSTSFGENPEQKALQKKLQPFRKVILEMVNKRETFAAIEEKVNSMILELGADNCHRKHIGEVLGHRIFRSTNLLWRFLKIKQLSVRHVFWLIYKSLATKKGWIDQSPNWNHRRTSNHKPFEGLWAVEPHFAIDGVGVKFEEILVITKDAAYWLDDDLPHTKAWAKA